MQNFIRLLDQFEFYVREHELSCFNSVTGPYFDEAVVSRKKMLDDHRKILVACVARMAVGWKFQRAETIGKSKPDLLKRLKEAKSVLESSRNKSFGKGKFDFKNKRLIGDDGAVLQWENNGQTTIGSVFYQLKS
jgi:hypothetical protein